MRDWCSRVLSIEKKGCGCIGVSKIMSFSALVRSRPIFYFDTFMGNFLLLIVYEKQRIG